MLIRASAHLILACMGVFSVPTKKDVIYLRTSTEEQDTENQLLDVKSIAPDNAEVVREHGSAWKDELIHRPQFSALVSAVKKGSLSSINVWDLDRLYRNRLKCADFMRLCQARGVVVRAYRQPWLHEFENLPGTYGDMLREVMIQFFSWMAEEESRKKSERVKAAYQRKKRLGKAKSWGRPGLPEETVRDIRSLLDQGLSYRKVREQVTYRKGKVKKHPSLGKIAEIAKES